VASHTDPVPRAAPGTDRDTRARLTAWALRAGASAWMTFLALLAALVVFGWPETWSWPWDWGAAGDGAPGHLVVLKVFALWGLSFLPGWLYVRFLGQRAGALWTEYVVNLHRLGWNRPGLLPRPPTDSPFYAEWVDDGGPQHDQYRNIYRQKFEAYYGREVVARMQGVNFAVRAGTMFPVFLATAIFAACWATVLVDPDFLTHPTSLWDMLRFAFLGAYAFVVQSLVRRFFQSDLKPSAYAAAVLRVVLVLLVMTALHQVLENSVSDGVEATVAFVIGIFPVIALQAMQRVAASALQVVVPQLTPDYPLNQLDGLNIWYESRLLEEGIEDMQNLVTANFVDVILHTRVPVGRLVDWVDQAALYVHLDRAERGLAERRLAHRARNDELKAQREKLAAGTSADGDSGDGAAAPPETGEAHDLVAGSVNHALRAGTQTRVALRQLGIRSATDLLKAFPPDQLDPYETPAPTDTAGPRFRVLMPGREHLDRDQVRLLVRVLDESTNLAPVWNWQTRGPMARARAQQPRSLRGGPGSALDAVPRVRPPLDDVGGSRDAQTAAAPPP
jgi:hypothetical protein